MPTNPPRDPSSLGETAERLLFDLIDAQRGLPRAQWLVTRVQGSVSVTRQDRRVNLEAYWGDVLELAEVGAIRFEQRDRNSGSFDIVKAGLDHYQDVKSRDGIGAIEEEVLGYMDSDGFMSRHPLAASKWASAHRILLGDGAHARVTSIGHDCREAMQAFGSELVDEFELEGVTEEANKDYAKVKAAVDINRKRLGQRVHAMLDALLHYWGTVADLAQRQEHNADLALEDARRLVFQTANAMSEVDRALHTKGVADALLRPR